MYGVYGTMYSNMQIRKEYLFIVAVISIISVISTLIASPSLVNNYGYYGVTNIVYGQTNADQANSTNTVDLINIQEIPLEKVHVGDIEIAYKMFGKGDPIILHNGASDNMEAWDPALLSRLASNNTVIVFDSRGIGNTAPGTAPYSVQLLANDTAGLMDALKIQEASILGYSLGSFITQQFAIAYPDKVGSVILIAGSCGGKDGIPKPAEFYKLQADIVNKTLNDVNIPDEEMKSLVTASLGPGWIRLHPESAMLPENMSISEAKPGLSPEAMDNQNNLGLAWEATNWNGVCDDLAKIAKPLLVMTGTDDNYYMPHENALVIAGEVPGSWLVQIKDAGHAVVDQYPDAVGMILQTFLSGIK
jgi:pimeloyl-ACP methyl ester carboxylesterase